ncbi:roadblock/LC7 domain-containing protein [Streptacidiphilus rugosus]|uniref:roadblock/LC7 domain-containing protein n=1 Tax=Streptacidiphilus rugosus TaxID=405783 RepID=UPI002FBD6F07
MSGDAVSRDTLSRDAAGREAMAGELRLLRERTAGVTDTAVAAVDGLLVAADAVPERDLETLAALGATTLGLARRTAAMTGRGALRRAVIHCSGGCAVVYAIGDTALLLVLGDEGLDLERLHLESGALIARMEQVLHGSGK